jgi:hypothetical protein
MFLLHAKHACNACLFNSRKEFKRLSRPLSLICTLQRNNRNKLGADGVVWAAADILQDQGSRSAAAPDIWYVEYIQL